MAIIVPAILEKTIDGFSGKVRRITKLPDVERIQVDFADGKFVENTTLSVADMDSLNPAFTWEAHLMVEEPVDFLDYQIAGFSIIIVHYEAFKSPDQIKPTVEEIKNLGMKVGIAINPATKIEVLKEFEESADLFLLMGIDNPGSQGQAFDPITIERVRSLRTLIPRAIIEVDGGVNSTNVKSLVQAGSDLLVVGSAPFETENIQENFDNLTSETIVQS